jgi:hypothetical protein
MMMARWTSLLGNLVAQAPEGIPLVRPHLAGARLSLSNYGYVLIDDVCYLLSASRNMSMDSFRRTLMKDDVTHNRSKKI